MTERLRYTGPRTATFITGQVGRVEPGAEFDVPDELLAGFMRRPDVEHAGDCPAPPCECGQDRGRVPQDAAPAPDGQAPATTSGGGQDDASDPDATASGHPDPGPGEQDPAGPDPAGLTPPPAP